MTTVIGDWTQAFDIAISGVLARDGVPGFGMYELKRSTRDGLYLVRNGDSPMAVCRWVDVKQGRSWVADEGYQIHL